MTDEIFLKITISLSLDEVIEVEKPGMDNELGVLGTLEKAKGIIKADYASKKTLVQPVLRSVS